MRRVTLVGYAMALLGGLLSGCSTQPPQQDAKLPKVWVCGVAQDTHGHPVPAAKVWAENNCTPRTTDWSGGFDIAGRSSDTTTGVCVMTPDQSLGAIAVLKPGKSPAVLTLQPLVTVEGRATTPSGVPANNLEFYMDALVGHQPHHHIRQALRTDAQGRFTATNLIPGASYRLFWNTDNAANRDYSYGQLQVNLADLKPGETLNIIVPKYVNVVMGKVVDPSGKPIAGAIVRPQQGTPLQPGDNRRLNEVTTDAQGGFTIGYLADGTLPLTVHAAGWKPTRFEVNTDDIDCRLQVEPIIAPATYRATVVDDDGKPIPNAQVTLMAEHMGRNQPIHHARKTAVTDAQGVAVFDGPAIPVTQQKLSQSTITMACDAAGYNLAFSRQAQAGEDMDERLVLSRQSGEWNGRVLDDRGHPVEGAKVAVHMYMTEHGDYRSTGGFAVSSQLPEAFSVLTDRDGRFSLRRVGQARLLQLSVQAQGMEGVDLPIDKTFDGAFILNRFAKIKGRVVYKDSGKLFASAEGTARVVFSRDDRKTSTDAPLRPDGTFDVDLSTPGHFSCWIYTLDPAMQRFVVLRPAEFSVRRGEASDVTIEVEPAGIPLSGTLTGTPPVDEQYRMVLCQVYATDPGQGFPYRACSVVAADGSWKLCLPPGQYDIHYAWPSLKKPSPSVRVEIARQTTQALVHLSYIAE